MSITIFVFFWDLTQRPLRAQSLLLIGRDLGQVRREQAFLFFLVQRQTSRRNDLRGDEHDQILLGMLFRVGAERPSDKWNIPYDGNLILSLLDVFAHQAAEDYRLSVINAHARGHFARAEHRLV